MDRICDIRPPGSPHAVYVNAPQLVERLLSKAVAGPNGCLIWTGLTDRDNYGQIKSGGKAHRVHRVLYQLLVLPLDGELTVDHACHNRHSSCPGGRECLHRRCINPHHLEAATRKENTLRSRHAPCGQNARKTHCLNGHPFDEANTYIDLRGSRGCRECRRARTRASQARRKARLRAAVNA